MCCHHTCKQRKAGTRKEKAEPVPHSGISLRFLGLLWQRTTVWRKGTWSQRLESKINRVVSLWGTSLAPLATFLPHDLPFVCVHPNCSLFKQNKITKQQLFLWKIFLHNTYYHYYSAINIISRNRFLKNVWKKACNSLMKYISPLSKKISYLNLCNMYVWIAGHGGRPLFSALRRERQVGCLGILDQPRIHSETLYQQMIWQMYTRDKRLSSNWLCFMYSADIWATPLSNPAFPGPALPRLLNTQKWRWGYSWSLSSIASSACDLWLRT